MIKGKDYDKYWKNEGWNTKHTYRQEPSFVAVRDECNLELVWNMIINEMWDDIDTAKKLALNCSQCKQARDCIELELYFNLLQNKNEQVWEFQIDWGM